MVRDNHTTRSMSSRANSTRSRKASNKSTSNPLVSDISEHFKKTNGDSQINEKDKEKKTSKADNKTKPHSHGLKEALNEQRDMNNTSQDKGKLSEELRSEDTNFVEAVTTQNMCTDNALDETAHKDNTGNLSEDIEEELDLETVSNKEVMIALKELTALVSKLDNDIHHPQKGVGAQIVKMTLRMDNLYSDIHGAVDGIIPKLTKATADISQLEARTKIIEENNRRLVDLLSESKKLARDITTMQGILQKNSQQLQHANHKIMDLTKRGMEQNLLIYGIDDSSSHWESIPSPDENGAEIKSKELCKYSVLKFLQQKMNVSLEIEDIWKAHRTGIKRTDRCQPMIVKVSYPAKELIMEHVTSLKDRVDTFGNSLYIKEQIPEGVMEKRKSNTARLKSLNKENDLRPKDQKNKIMLIQDRIVINGEMDIPEVQTPQPAELFMNSEVQKEVDAMHSKLHETETINLRNSSFIGHALKVCSTKEVNLAYKALAQRYAAVDHIFMAYALKEDGIIKHGHCDDNEHGGGNCIHKILLNDKVKDTAIFIVRRFGGIHLGLDRFHTIESVAKQAIRLIHPEYVSRPKQDQRQHPRHQRKDNPSIRGNHRGGFRH